jgi:hypothetical protein
MRCRTCIPCSPPPATSCADTGPALPTQTPQPVQLQRPGRGNAELRAADPARPLAPSSGGLGSRPLGRSAQCPQRRGGGLVFREIKERHRKTVPMPWPLVRKLRTHRAQQKRERLAAANMWEDFGVVFGQENRRPLDPHAD